MEKSRLERFFAKIDCGEPVDFDRCWIWNGAKNEKGYGLFWTSKTLSDRAHRASYRLFHGGIPELPNTSKHGTCILHHCDNPECTNPTHLYAGTNTDNQRDMYRKGRGRKAKGSNNSASKLTEEQVLQIRAERKEKGTHLMVLAEKFGVSRSTIKRVLYRSHWTHV